MIELLNISKRFKRTKALSNANVSFEQGHCYAIIGHNGSGKTTMLKSILGLIIPGSGSIRIDGKNQADGVESRSNIGYMSQHAQFPENLTIVEMIKMIEKIRGKSSNADFYIDLFNLEKEKNKKIGQLSGGNRQKVNAVICFMFEPEYIICDEPMSALDPVASVALKELFVKFKDEGRCVIVVTHSMALAEELADTVCYLSDGVISYFGPLTELKSSYQDKPLEQVIASMAHEKMLKHV